jgi:uncharacterized protein YceK
MKNTLIYVLLALSLSGCGSINAWMAAKDNIIEQDYKGAKANLQRSDDDALALWVDSACDVKVGALQRRPDALTPVMDACPVNNMARVQTSNGSVTLTTPNSVNLVQQPANTASAPDPTTQALQTITQTLQAIQSQISAKPVVTPAPAVKAAVKPIPGVSIPLPKPAIVAPVKVTPKAAPVIAPAQSLLSAPVVPK